MADTSTASAPAPPSRQPVAAPGRSTADWRRANVAIVTEAFLDLQRTVRRSRARLLAAAAEDIESATQLLLHTVAAEGPMRASGLAASVQADLSTVSREVSALVSRGLLERRADQCDGRASLLMVTESGRAVMAEHEQRRAVFFDHVLTDWTAEDLARFAEQMSRFAAAYEDAHTVGMTRLAARRPTEPRPRSSPASTRRRCRIPESD